MGSGLDLAILSNEYFPEATLGPLMIPNLTYEVGKHYVVIVKPLQWGTFWYQNYLHSLKNKRDMTDSIFMLRPPLKLD